jgi:hypothetical protein
MIHGSIKTINVVRSGAKGSAATTTQKLTKLNGHNYAKAELKHQKVCATVQMGKDGSTKVTVCKGGQVVHEHFVRV